MDTHAGAGVYDLSSDYARQNAEYETGIGRLWGRPDLPEAVARYVERVRGLNPDGRLRLYPGSPWLASRLMRRQGLAAPVRALPHGRESAAPDLRRSGSPGAHRGRRRLRRPEDLAATPSQRRLTLLDPAYEVKTDYRAVVQALKAGLERFATGIYAV